MTIQYPFVIVDGSSYFYRAFHAMPPLTNSHGEPTGAVYGVVNMIKKLIKDYPCDYFAVIFDAKGRTFRDEIYPDYKATRPPMPDDLKSQFQPMVDIIQAMGIPVLIIDGVEADDVIGTLVKQAEELGLKSLVSTGDKDMAQLVNNHTHLINTMSGQLLDPAGVGAKFGVKPEQIIDYLTLMGDKVDNVPGVEKCGPKTAVKWLDAYGNLDTVIQKADEVKGRVGENLRSSLADLPRSRELVTIKTDVALTQGLADLVIQKPNQKLLIELYTRLEFKSWLNEQLDNTKPQIKTNYQAITDRKSLENWLKKIKNILSIDTETTSLDYMSAELVGISMAIEPGHAVYVPYNPEVLALLKPIIENPNIQKIGQNLKYDYHVLANYGINLNGITYDTMLESYVINSSASRHNMDTLALKYLGRKTMTYEELVGKGAKQIPFSNVPLDKATEYAAEDADVTLQLHQTLWPKLEGKLKSVFTDIELPLLTVLAKIERHGVLLDAQLLEQQDAVVTEQLSKLTQKAYQLAGEEFNLASTKQLGEILFNKLNIPIISKTPKGAPSTAESVLQELAFDYPLPKLIIEHRQLAKLKSTYLDALPKQINPHTGRVHTSYNQAVTSTGRLSSTEPNLQNIPVRTQAGRQIRQAFIAPKGYKIIAADYSQIELRIMTHFSQDKGLQQAFHHGWDIHTATAAEVFGVAQDQVTPDLRRKSKAINFGLIYGMSAFGLARQIESSREEAQEYINLYFERYPGVKNYMDSICKTAKQQGYVETLYGRRLYLPEINAKNFQRQKAAERTAINAPMQGTAADMIKIAMLQIDQWIKDLDAKMIMQVHDELVFEVSDKIIEAFTAGLQAKMCHCDELSVPIEVAIGIGDNWETAH